MRQEKRKTIEREGTFGKSLLVLFICIAENM